MGNYPQPARQELYDVNFPRIRANMMRRIAPGTYLGLRYVMDDFNITGRDPDGLLIQDEITGAAGGLVSGLGPVMNFDSRDNIFWSTKGAFIEALAMVNLPAFGSDFSFARFSVDASWTIYEARCD